jgi:hypothetical protein
MLTDTLRFKKFYVTPNFTMDHYSFDQYRDAQYINGQFTVNTKELINKVNINYTTDDEYNIFKFLLIPIKYCYIDILLVVNL